MSSLILTGVIGSLCWPTSYQRIYTASGVGAVKKGTVQTMIVAGGFYALLTLVALAASGLDVVSAKPQDGWFTLLYRVGGEWMLGLAIVIVLAASMGCGRLRAGLRGADRQRHRAGGVAAHGPADDHHRQGLDGGVHAGASGWPS